MTVDAGGVAIAMGAEAIVFYLGNGAVSKMGGRNRKDLNPAADAPPSGSGRAIVPGTVLDGIPSRWSSASVSRSGWRGRRRVPRRRVHLDHSRRR